MNDLELLKNTYEIIDMCLKNAAHSFGLDFAILNDTAIEVVKRIRAIDPSWTDPYHNKKSLDGR